MGRGWSGTRRRRSAHPAGATFRRDLASSYEVVVKIRPAGVTGVPDSSITPMLIIDVSSGGGILKINNTSLIVFLTISEVCS